MTFITEQFNQKNSKKGLSLIELMVAITLMSIVMTAILSSYMALTRSAMAIGNYSEMSEKSRYALELFSRDVRMTSDISSFDATSFTVTSLYGDADERTISYSYDALTDLLTRTEDGTAVTILDNAIDCEFKYYNILDVETTNSLEIQKVKFTARLLKRVLYLANTYDVISAEFMIRNRKVTN